MNKQINVIEWQVGQKPCCPKNADESLHPRVFIPLESIGDEQACPYCGQAHCLIE